MISSIESNKKVKYAENSSKLLSSSVKTEQKKNIKELGDSCLTDKKEELIVLKHNKNAKKRKDVDKDAHSTKKIVKAKDTALLQKSNSIIENIRLDPSSISVGNTNWRSYNSKEAPIHYGEKEIPIGSPACLQGFVFILTGVLDSLEREDAVKLIDSCGGTTSKTVGKKVTHALVGKEAGPSKLKQIQERNIPIIDEDGLFQLIKGLSCDSMETTLTENTQDYYESQEKKKEIKNEIKKENNSTKSISNKKIFQSLNASLSSPIVANISTMWTDKYKPMSSKDLVGNPSKILKLKNWLENWQTKFKIQTDKKSQKNESKSDSLFPIACLITGPPGVGKTCSTMVVANEVGYRAVYLNASDQRSKLTLKENVKSLLDNHGINEYFGNICMKTVLVMDEIDGMSSGDRGGLQELNSMLKQTQIPIIALANDKYKVRTFASSPLVLSLNYDRPSLSQLLPKISSIISNENFYLPEQVLKKTIESCQGDIRMILNSLEFLSKDSSALNQSNINSNELKKHLQNSNKDITMSAFDVIPKIFQPTLNNLNNNENKNIGYSFNEKLNFYFVDYGLIPMFVQQNYLKVKPHSKASILSELSSIAKASDSISEGDLISSAIYSGQNFALLPVHAVVSTLRPAFIMNGSCYNVEFPTILGKISSASKRHRILNELQTEMYVGTNGTNSTGILLDYIPLLSSNLIQPLVKSGQQGFQSVVELMDIYSISKETRESIFELSELKLNKNSKPSNPFANLPSNIKSAFTRYYNSKKHVISSKTRISKIYSQNSQHDEDAEDPQADDTQQIETNIDSIDSIPNDPFVTISKKSIPPKQKNKKQQ